MSRPRCKDDMMQAAADGYMALNVFVESMTTEELNTPFDFSADEKKTEAHWGRDKNLRDVIVHLHEWQKLMLAFVQRNTTASAIVFPFLPEQYSWKTYGVMNEEIFARHQTTPLDEARRLLDESHSAVLALADTFSNEELFTKKHFRWTGTTDLGSYFVSTLSSHYDWALKKLKAHRKRLK